MLLYDNQTDKTLSSFPTLPTLGIEHKYLVDAFNNRKRNTTNSPDE